MDPHTPASSTSPASSPSNTISPAPSSAGTHPGGANGSSASSGAGGNASKPAAPAIDASAQAEIDDAMAALGLGERGASVGTRQPKKERKSAQPAPTGDHNVQPIGGAAKPRVHGPRVVQAGREHRSGTVVSVGPTDLFLEFGPKELGVAPRSQWPEDEVPKVGDEVKVVVDRFEPAESVFICSRPGSVQKAAWEMLEIGSVVEARVTGVNKGGLELEVAGHRAFMPASQVALDRVPDLSVFVDQKLACKVTQLDKRGAGNIVLSRRDVLETERQEQAEKIKQSLKEGDLVDGVVRKIMPFGAFVDLGGLDGLIHISDLSYDRVNYGENQVARHLKEGQAVRVKVLKIDWEHNRLSLGLKQMAADPFANTIGQITDGAEVTGRVTRLAEFGAFVELAPGVEGLVHISEIAYKRIATPGDVLKVDEIIKVKVLKIDNEQRRISLSVKACLPPPEGMGGGGGGPGAGGRGGPKRGGKFEDKRTPEEILKESPALRRLRERFGKQGFKGGLG